MPHRRKASVLVIVLVTIVFATTALLLFIERAADDLIVPIRTNDSNRLRSEAFSALDTTLAVLVDFNNVNGGLRSPAEGWNDPLTWAGYTPSVDSRTVVVSFEDESGKISLPTATQANLNNLFTYWGMSTQDSQTMIDGLFTWMKTTYTPTSATAETVSDYQQDPIPFNSPKRSLRTWNELASITTVKALLFDENGNLNDLGKRFEADFSLYSFTSSNVNGGNHDVIVALGSGNSGANGNGLIDDAAVQKVLDYLAGSGSTVLAGGSQSGGFFKNTTDVGTVAGVLINYNKLTTVITALRVNVTVKEGQAYFKLSAVVAPPSATGAAAGSGATVVAVPALTGNATTTTTGSTVTAAPTAPIALSYPFTILELSETDQDPALTANATTSNTTTDSFPFPAPAASLQPSS